MKSNLQKDEHEFIESVVDAIITKDKYKEHYLINDRGVMIYECITANDDGVEREFGYESGERAEVVCVFGEELIENLHYKTGSDDLSVPWAKKCVKSIINHGKMVARSIEW